MGIDSCARGTAAGLCAAGCTVAVSTAVPATGAAILSKAGYSAYSASALAKAGAIGSSMTTAPISCCLGGIAGCQDEGNVEIKLGGSEGNACIPITTMAGSAFVQGVGIESAATASVVGGAAIAAGVIAVVAPVACAAMARD